MILESRLNLSRDSWIRKKSRAIKYRAASLIKWVSCIIPQVEDKWHCVMPLSSLALLPVLSVRINKAVILGSDMIQCFTVFPPVSLASLSGCSPPGEGERRHRVHPPCLSQGKGWAERGRLFIGKGIKNLMLFPPDHHQSCPGAVLLLGANLCFSAASLLMKWICFRGRMFKILISLGDGPLYSNNAFKSETFLLRSNTFRILRRRGEILFEREIFRVRWQFRNTSTRKGKLFS